VLGARILRGEPRTAVMPGEIPKVFAVAALAAIWTPVLARPPLARVLETLGPAVILGAWLMGACLRLPRAPKPGGDEDHAASTITRSHRRGVWWPALVMTLAIAGTWAAVAVMTEFGRQLERSGVFEGPGGVAGRVTATVRGLATAPAVDGWAPKGSTGGRALTRYVYECTRPTDDLLILAFEPEMYFYSERGLAARYLFVLAGYWSSMADQQQAIGVLQTRSAPVVLWNRQTYQPVETDFALLHAYLMTRYDTVRESTFGEPGSTTWRVLVDRSAVVSRTYEPLGLPCFAEAPKG
jgi:hypothetical protein